MLPLQRSSGASELLLISWVDKYFTYSLFIIILQSKYSFALVKRASYIVSRVLGDLRTFLLIDLGCSFIHVYTHVYTLDILLSKVNFIIRESGKNIVIVDLK